MPLRARKSLGRMGAAVLVVSGLVVGGWAVAPYLDVAELSERAAPHRYAWYALPAVTLAFVVLGLLMVPVLVLIVGTGIAFGPVLGPTYAMAGCLASAAVGFAIGRRIGAERLERAGGTRVTRLTRVLERNGTLAVFFLRKIPAPFILANVVAGAARIRFRDFVAGTLLGMGALVVALAGFGYQLGQLLDDPSPRALVTAGLFLGIPLTLAWFINRSLRRSRSAA